MNVWAGKSAGAGWQVEVANLQLFHRAGYQSIMGQLHRQLQEGSAPAPKEPAPKKKAWFKWK
jgi:hypothetical protein